MIRVFILVSSTIDRHRQNVFQHMLDASDVDIVGVCIDDRPSIGSIAKVWRELKRGRGGYVVVQCIKTLISSGKKRDMLSSDFFAKSFVWCIRSQDLYSPETVKQICSCRPDVIFRSGFGIIREPILSIIPYGVLSYHHGDMRKYRGQPEGFWELYHGEKEMKVTVQRLSAGLDCGTIVKEMTIPIRRDDTWARLYNRAYSMSSDLALDAIRLCVRSDSQGVSLSKHELGKLYTTPNLRQWMTMQIRVFGRIMRVWMNRLFLHER